MSRLPYPEEVTVADAIAFDAFSPEMKRIAVAGVAVHRMIEERVAEETEAARTAAWESGYAERAKEIDEALHHALDRLGLFRQKIATADSRYLELGEIIADLTKLVLPQ